MPTIDRYVTPLKLPMTIDAFWRFPNLPAYEAKYQAGHAELTYRPRLSMGRLRISAREERKINGVAIRPLDVARTVEPLSKLFAAAFAKVPPLDGMAPTTRRHAAETAMKNTATDGDGELFRAACFAANDVATGEILGAAIVTKIRLRSDEWPEEELPTPLLNLTWLFVTPQRQRNQIGTALLDRVVNELSEQRVPWLVSHLLIDNTVSTMFHWRSGFELVSAISR